MSDAYTLIQNGLIIDGTGSDPFPGDVLIKVFGVCDVACVGATATIELGVSGNTAVLIAQTTAADLIACLAHMNREVAA